MPVNQLGGELTDNDIVTVGRMVDVADRTWPGMNKRGGVARVMHIHTKPNSENVTHVDVHYIVSSGREKHIPIQFISLAPEYETSHSNSSGKTHLRDRSLLLGRCNRCGSLRTDCGSCDWQTEHDAVPRIAKEDHQNERAAITKENDKANDGTNSSDEDEWLQSIVQKNQLRYRRFLRTESRNRKFQDSLGLVGLVSPTSDKYIDQSSSSDSDGFDTTLKQLSMLASSKRTGNDMKSTTRKTKQRPQRQQQREKRMKQFRQQNGSTETQPRDFRASESVDIPPRSQDSNGVDGEALPYLSSPGGGPHYVVEDSLAGFIQPEGMHVANQLPDDVRDLTKDIPFPSLPAFFDSMATELQDVRIPDAELKIAELEGTISEMEFQDENIRDDGRDTGSGLRQISNILVTFQELEQTLQDSLLHGCLDQCRSALRQLSDRKLYRRHKATLTKEQRKQIRGSNTVEAREIRMDALELATKDTLVKLKRLKARYANNEEQSDYDTEADDKGDETNSYSSAMSQGNCVDDDEDQPVHSARSFKAFQPHKYASRVRKENDYASSDIPRHHKFKRFKQRHYSETKYRGKVQHKAGESRRGGKKRFRDHSEQKLEQSDAEDNFVAHVDESSEEEGGDHVDERSNRISEHLFEIERSRPAASFRNRDGKNQRGETVQNHATHGPNRRSIAERMQSFLNANESQRNDVGLTSENEDRHSLNGNTNELNELDKSGSAQNETTITRTTTAQRFGMNPEGEISADVLFQDAISSKNESTSVDEGIGSRSMTRPVIGVCHDIEKNHGNIFATFKLLDEIENARHSATHSQDDTFLESALKVLQHQGGLTMQELIFSSNPAFGVHVRLLSECMHRLKRNDGSNCTIDQPARQIFFEKQETLIAFLVLQLVDCLYAIMCPKAWDMRRRDLGRILKELVPLREALSCIVPLTERISQCLIQDFKPQKWWKGSSDTPIIFVSAVDPEEWRSFIMTGAYISSANSEDNSRLSMFGRSLPMCEVETLWKILAFTGASCVVSADKTFARWQLIPRLFSPGATSPVSQPSLPPSDLQLETCGRHLKYLNFLLMRGTMNPLPPVDSVLFDLAKKCLLLEAERYFADDQHNSSSSFAGRNNDARLLLNAKLRKYRSQSRADFSGIQNIDVNLSSSSSSATSLLALLPHSPILNWCMLAMKLWITHVTPKKARVSRLCKSIRSLVGALLSEAKAADALMQSTGKIVAEGTPNFESAFCKATTLPGNKRKSMYLMECAVFLKVIGFSFPWNESKDIDMGVSWAELCCDVWRTTSDDRLQKLQEMIADNDDVDLDLDFEDHTNLLSSAKMMTLLAVTLLKNKKQQLLESEENCCICKVASCVVACLVAAVKSQRTNDIAWICTLLAMIYRGATTVTLTGNSKINHAPKAIKELAQQTAQYSLRLVLRAFQNRLTEVEDNTSASWELESFLLVFEAMADFAASSSPESSEVPPTTAANPDTEDSIWGDLDDSAFDDIDMPSTETEENPKRRADNYRHISALWQSLTDCLDVAKPSSRFAVAQFGSNAIKSTTIAARLAIPKHVEKLCRCLSSVASILLRYDLTCNRSIESVCQSQQKTSDADFYNSVARYFCQALSAKISLSACHQASFGNNRQFVYQILVKETFNSTHLEKLPSCHLKGMKANGGASAEQHALASLFIMNDQSDLSNDDQQSAQRSFHVRARRQCNSFWKFTSTVGLAISKLESPDASDTILQGVLENSEKRNEDIEGFLPIASIEQEALKRFALLHDWLGEMSRNNKESSFESVSCLAVTALGEEIARMVRGLNYYKLDGQMMSGETQSFRHAKLHEFVAVYVEILIAALACILLFDHSQGSNGWKEFIAAAKQRVLLPFLREQNHDFSKGLHDLLTLANGITKSHRRINTLPPFHAVFGADDQAEYVFTRCRQIFRHLSRNVDHEKSLTFVSACISHVVREKDEYKQERLAKWTASCLGTDTTNFHTRGMDGSPFSKALDDYLIEELATLPHTSIEKAVLGQIRLEVLKALLAPRLLHARASDHERRGTLRLISHMVAIKGIFDATSNEQHEVVEVVATIAKGVTFVLRNILQLSVVDDGAAVQAIHCAKAIANASPPDSGFAKTIIEWSRKIVLLTPASSAASKIPEVDRHGVYLWTFFRWVGHVCNAILRSGEKRALVTAYRKLCMAFAHNKESLKLDIELQTAPLIVMDGQLRKQEAAMFTTDLFMTTVSVQNVYERSTNPSISKDVSYNRWIPQPSVEKSSKQFLADIVSLSNNF